MINLYPYQKKALSEIQERAFKAILALDMGLGKTILSLYTAKALVSKNPSLKIIITCPLAVLDNWAKEAKLFFPENQILIITSCSLDRAKLKQARVFIIGHEFLTQFYSPKNSIFRGPAILICDEAHKIKNPKTKLFETLYKIRNQIDCKACLLLTATPILHRPGEIWPQIKLVDPDFSIPYQEFVDKFSKYQNQFNHYGLKKARTYKKIIEKYCIIINQKEANLKLPTLKIKPIFLKGGYRDRYITSLEKIPETLKISKELIRRGQKVLIFAWYRETVQKLKESLESQGFKVLIYTGGLTPKKRKEIIESFRKDYQILVGNIAALGVGANLQFCKRAIIHDLVWSPEEINQAIKRIHRIGSKEPVEVYVPLFEKGFDKRLLRNFLEKEKMIKKVKRVSISWKNIFLETSLKKWGVKFLTWIGFVIILLLLLTFTKR